MDLFCIKNQGPSLWTVIALKPVYHIVWPSRTLEKGHIWALSSYENARGIYKQLMRNYEASDTP